MNSVQVVLNEDKLNKSAKAFSNNKGVSLKFSPEDWNSGETINLTKSQFARVDKRF
jgi:hypothetical protein